MRTRALWLAASLAVGCARPVGLERYAYDLERPYDCELRYEYVHVRNPNAMTGYAQVATITVREAPSEWTPDLQRRVRPLGCRVGGDAVGLLVGPEPSRTLLVLRDVRNDELASVE